MARRRFQRGYVRQNKTGTLWIGEYSEYALNASGVEIREPKYPVLCPVVEDGEVRTKRYARRKLQPYLDRVNSQLSVTTREQKYFTVSGFLEVWERDYLIMQRPSTQATVRGHLKRIKNAWAERDMRSIDAGDLQRLIAVMEKEGKSPKTLKNLWSTVSLIWSAALAQKAVDHLLPKPKLPRAFKSQPRCFRLGETGKILSAEREEYLRTLYWLDAETGLRAGELAALRIEDVEIDRLTVEQSVWHGKVGQPKTNNSKRTLALSCHLSAMLQRQIERQREKGHALLFSTSIGKPLDPGLLVKRKLHPLLDSLSVTRGGLHAFRHFNASLLAGLRVPLKTIQERLGHVAAAGLPNVGITIDVYIHSEWNDNVLAAESAAEMIRKAENSTGLTPVGTKANFVSD